jgi:hypothetical protein
MDHSTDAERVSSDSLGLSAFKRLVDRSASAHVQIREYAGHWVVRRDEMPAGGEEALEAAARALLVSAEDPDHALRRDEDGSTLGSLDGYSLDPCPDEPEICWRLDHLALRVHRVH